MKLEEVLHVLRDGKGLYNSEYHQYIEIKKEDNKVTGGINLTLIDNCGCRFEFFAELLLSGKWNIVE